MVAPFSRCYSKFELVLVLTQENAFVSKSTEKAQDLLKNCTRNYFQNSYPLEKSACFYVTITENFERFQYFNFKSNFPEIENHFQKVGVMFFSAKIENNILIQNCPVRSQC